MYGAILPRELTNEDIRNSEAYKEYYAIASREIPPKTKASKKKVDFDDTTKQTSPSAPKEKKGTKTGKGKQKAKELETISNVAMKEAEQLKTIIKRSRKETYRLHASESGADEGTDDDEEAQTESEDDGDDFIHSKLTTHDDEETHEEETNEDDTFDPTIHTPSHVTTTDDEDSDTDVEGERSNDDTTKVEDQGNEADRDTNANLEGRDDAMIDVELPQVRATHEIEDTYVTLTPVNPDGQQQSSSVSSGFISNMLNPNQDIGVDAIFGPNTEVTSLVDIPVTAIAEPSFFTKTNLPPTLTPLFTQLQQPPILTPAITPSSSLHNLPNFGSLFGFDNRLKALEDNFSEFKQSTQVAETLSSIPGIVDQYLANKMKEAVDVKHQVKTEVSKIIPKIEKLVNEQLESAVLVRSSREAKTSHAVDANLSELELKKILIDKMEANKSIGRFDIQQKLYKALVDAYEADKILLDTYGDTVTLKTDIERSRMMIKNPR
ncbi:hypothetical protein Tco_0190220 [Tanacetum coccineum]